MFIIRCVYTVRYIFVAGCEMWALPFLLAAIGAELVKTFSHVGEDLPSFASYKCARARMSDTRKNDDNNNNNKQPDMPCLSRMNHATS